jgi:hypothetical protein
MYIHLLLLLFISGLSSNVSYAGTLVGDAQILQTLAETPAVTILVFLYARLYVDRQ